MFFIILTFISAFSIEAIGTFISIMGLSALFAMNPLIIGMAVTLDVGKVVAVSFLYKNWQRINLIMKAYMSIASLVLIFITSMGIFGFLSGEFQKAIVGNNQQNITISALTDEQGRLQKRKEEIDKQIAQLPASFVSGRTRLMNQFKDETRRINTRLNKIDEELPGLKIQNIERGVKIGPILYIAEAFGTTPEAAAKYVILVIIGVFDPLAIALLLAGNFLLDQRQRDKIAAQNSDTESVHLDVKIVDELPPVEVPAPKAPIAEAPKVEQYHVEEIPPSPADDIETQIRVARRPWNEAHARVVVEPKHTRDGATPAVESAETVQPIRAKLENASSGADIGYSDDQRMIASLVSKYENTDTAPEVRLS